MLLENKHRINIHGKFISLYGFEIKYDQEQEIIKEKILKEFSLNEFSPPKYSDLEAKEKDLKNLKMVFESLLDEGVIIRVSEDCFFTKIAYDKCRDMLVKYINEHGSITVAQLRDLLDTSRKYAMSLIEHFDAIKLTKRIGDKRVLF